MSTAYHHLTRTIEVSRVHLFDILTQYRAIFPDDDSAYHSSVTTPTHVDGALFYTWLGSKVSQHASPVYFCAITRNFRQLILPVLLLPIYIPRNLFPSKI